MVWIEGFELARFGFKELKRTGLLDLGAEMVWALRCLALKRPWRFGAEVPQCIVVLVLKCPGRFGIEGLGGLGPAKLGLQRIGPREAEPHSYSGAF